MDRVESSYRSTVDQILSSDPKFYYKLSLSYRCCYESFFANSLPGHGGQPKFIPIYYFFLTHNIIFINVVTVINIFFFANWTDFLFENNRRLLTSINFEFQQNFYDFMNSEAVKILTAMCWRAVCYCEYKQEQYKFLLPCETCETCEIVILILYLINFHTPPYENRFIAE